ncbi:extracellular solute-binding protein [Treponema sp.]|uniref:ABC transporter substrate-binding protein n=1 Tax=Treponema sp. TaxID=166 RepID=UPI0025E3A114|nr:extracellular solute-binding protein [Treponema sp.]MCR5218273.1 extracellular solute-binding protein [Treponema sp.]
MKTVKYFYLCLLIIAVIFTAAGCKEEKKKNKIVLHVFSNLPDRESGQGLIEQMIIDEYMKENPGVSITVEALDEAAFKTKFYVYCHERMPDIVSMWGQRPVLEQAVNSGKLLELNKSDFWSFGFKQHSMDGFTMNGKLYGLPRNTDMALLFYNKKMFDAFDWELPQTLDELIKLSVEIKALGFIPVSMDGSDGWPLMILLSDIFNDLAGKEYAAIIDHAIETHDFSHPYIREALEIFSYICSKNIFQDNFAQDDYGAAQNTFTSGKSAMFYMGSWATSIASNSNYLNEITPYIHAATFPLVKENAQGKNNLLAWYGGGYGISTDCDYKEEALNFIKFMFAPKRLSKLGLENSVGLSAQHEMDFLEYAETPCLMELINIADNESLYSGTPINDRSNIKFKYITEFNIIRLASGQITVEDFIQMLQKENVY